MQEYQITDRVKFLLYPQYFAFEIDGILYDNDWTTEDFDDFKDLIVHGLEELDYEFCEHCPDEDEYQEFLTNLQTLGTELLACYA